jgi:DNA excision repair protein ERCC-4
MRRPTSSPRVMDQEDTLHIVIDDREAPNSVPAILCRCIDVETRTERLALGDYLVDDALLFERKTLRDFARSIQDGRLFSQASRLARSPHRTAIILEGRGRDRAGSRMRREAIQGALATLTLHYGLPLLRAICPQETADLMLLTARQRRASADRACPRLGHRPGPRPSNKTRLQSHLLQGLPGVGPARAKQLIEQFGSVAAVMAAPTDALAEVPGIGQKTARAIRWAVEEPAGSYAANPTRFDRVRYSFLNTFIARSRRVGSNAPTLHTLKLGSDAFELFHHPLQ